MYKKTTIEDPIVYQDGALIARDEPGYGLSCAENVF